MIVRSGRPSSVESAIPATTLVLLQIFFCCLVRCWYAAMRLAGLSLHAEARRRRRRRRFFPSSLCIQPRRFARSCCDQPRARLCDLCCAGQPRPRSLDSTPHRSTRPRRQTLLTHAKRPRGSRRGSASALKTTAHRFRPLRDRPERRATVTASTCHRCTRSPSNSDHRPRSSRGCTWSPSTPSSERPSFSCTRSSSAPSLSASFRTPQLASYTSPSTRTLRRRSPAI